MGTHFRSASEVVSKPDPMMGLPEGVAPTSRVGTCASTTCQISNARRDRLPFYAPTVTCSLQSTMNCGHAPPGGHRAVPMAVTVA